tara:strand:- start:20941 stop:26613 length:5673 start_codon:yes stop_codon:yes gene_type:complete
MIENSKGYIRLKGVRQNNLKGFDLRIPLGQLVVVTGLSGTGKSSLVFETLHAEGQRRYVETFSPYARQFLEMLDRPNVESIENIRPSIAIQQSNKVRTSRSTVGTMTELCDYFKVWFSHAASLYDPETGEKIDDDNPQTIFKKASTAWSGKTLLITFEIRRPKHYEWEKIIKSLTVQGYSRILHNGQLVNLEDCESIDLSDSSIFVIQDRICLTKKNESRFLEGCRTALRFGRGRVHFFNMRGVLLGKFSEGLNSPVTGQSFRSPSPSMFSSNSPVGACPKCRGFGRIIEIDYRLVMPDHSLSISGGLIKAFHGTVYSESQRDLLRACNRKKVPTDVPFHDLSPKHQAFVLDGESDYQLKKKSLLHPWYGVRKFFNWLEKNTYKIHVRVFLSRYRTYTECPKCKGSRLKPEALNWRWHCNTLPDLYKLPISKLFNLLTKNICKTGSHQADVAAQSIITRIQYLLEVGLGYITLDRQSRTLSGGEIERVNLTSCLGTSLVDTLFVLDEPSIGLHSRDIERLISILRKLKDQGNTVIVVEHDESIIKAADHIIELGPSPGSNGGKLVFSGGLPQLLPTKASMTAAYLTDRKWISIPEKRRTINVDTHDLVRSSTKLTPGLSIFGASKHNIRNLSLRVPLGRLIGLSGVSGSGKSTLLDNIIYQGLLASDGIAVDDPAKISKISSDVNFSEVALVDQSPVNKNSRSNPALYSNVWNPIRELFAKMEQAKLSGLNPSSFSFNSGNGRCEECKGLGYERVEMQFVADVFVTCSNCEGQRFKPEVLEVSYQDKSIADILRLTVSGAISLFKGLPSITNRLEILEEVGLGYLILGQPLSTISGGESQRLKLIKYIPKVENSSKPALLLLDEPTTGLHRHDVKSLIGILHKLVNQGNSVIIIEHHLDLLKSTDWIIEMGPEAGSEGGRIIFQGTPEDLVQKSIPTARFLRGMMKREKVKETVRRTRIESIPDQSCQPLGNQNLHENKNAITQNLAAEIDSENENNEARYLQVRGARENNLKNFSVSIPHRKLTVVTGVSGSGKSTLAFDIVFAEGQRRFMESMSPYARQHVEQMARPDVDQITGMLPTVAIEQRATHGTRKSTVSTITEVAQYFRLLFARTGIQHNPRTNNDLISLPATALLKRLKDILKKNYPSSVNKLYLCSPLVRGRKGHHQPLANWASGRGFKLLRVNGRLIEISRFKKLDRYSEHDIEVVVAEFTPRQTTPLNLLRERLEEALQLNSGSCFLARSSGQIETWLSTKRTDPSTGESFPDLDPKNFSWNSPKGWCPSCRGYGQIYEWMLQSDDFPTSIARMEPGNPCSECGGSRINEIGRAVYLCLENGRKMNLPELLGLPPRDILECLHQLKLDRRGRAIVKEILPEIEERLNFMNQLGLGYLTLDRATSTLSGGEAQRIRLAAQLGSTLSGVLYVLDEPSIGLHARDNAHLLKSLQLLRRNGNTLLVVEHDEGTMTSADHIVDIGPGAGQKGGAIIAEGTLSEVKKVKSSLTSHYLKKGIQHPLRGKYRSLPKLFNSKSPSRNPDWLLIRRVTLRNLKGQDLHLPLGRLIIVCGISGAGKSTLIRDLVGPLVAYASCNRLKRLSNRSVNGTLCDSVSTFRRSFKDLLNGHVFRNVIEVDQKPIGKTPRSTPATYIKVFDIIRRFFASLPVSRIRGYDSSTFSFNTKQGRCEECSGAGRIKLEMSFMPDAYIICEKCSGNRYSPELEDVKWKDKNIADVLNMTFEEAAGFFDFHSKLKNAFNLMLETGLGYLTLGQSSPTLSGGESQRLKLVSELAKGFQSYSEEVHAPTSKNLYIIEEPTIGLHLYDCERLIKLLHRIVDQGHTVIVIEHNLDLIAEADYIVEVGPEGGESGGEILYQGPTTGFLDCNRSPTAPFLKQKLSTS